jgi:hypothetical protein
MKLSHRIRLAALVGAVKEAILATPLLLVYFLDLTVIVPTWERAVLALLIQAALFALLAFVVINLLCSRIALQFSFRSKRVLVAAFAPPLVVLLMCGALRFPYWLVFYCRSRPSG